MLRVTSNQPRQGCHIIYIEGSGIRTCFWASQVGSTRNNADNARKGKVQEGLLRLSLMTRLFQPFRSGESIAPRRTSHVTSRIHAVCRTGRVQDTKMRAFHSSAVESRQSRQSRSRARPSGLVVGSGFRFNKAGLHRQYQVSDSIRVISTNPNDILWKQEMKQCK